MTLSRLVKLQTDFSEFLQRGRHESRIAAQLRPPSINDSSLRLDVYRNGYFIRLEKALAHDFPVTAETLGPETFAREAGEYVQAHPSRHPSLRHAGREFPAWLRSHSGSAVGDLAAIEWAVMRVFDGPDCVPAQADCLEEIAPDAWERLHISLVPTLSVLALTSNADRVWLARGERTDLQPTSTRWIAISRDARIRPNLADLDQGTFAVLNALSTKLCLAKVNEHLAQEYDPENLPEQVAKALHIAFASNWVADASVRDQEGDAN